MAVPIDASTLEIHIGTISYFNRKKHFGFIIPDIRREDGRRVFFHINDGCGVNIENNRPNLFGVYWNDMAPTEGTRVVYYSAEDSRGRGPKVIRWALEKEWNDVVDRIAGK